ncbi:hypothetical protein [Pseudomonas bohemica]|uniref:hypothetical protein n=1 Tax=Pseudomonas bohemica TaxID=2044872 RepID=UPI000DA624B0|nr:hypothetical protein [Pseudomonas bohemica]
MSNIIKFPPQNLAEPIDVDQFKKHSDASLLLFCFEMVGSVSESIEAGEEIKFQGEAYMELVQAFWALQTLFERRTGACASEVSAEHWMQMRKHALEGGPEPVLRIPRVAAGCAPYPPEVFNGLSDIDLGRAGLLYARRVNEAIANDSPHALDIEEARVSSIDTMTVIRELVLRLTGEPVGGACRPAGETLQ